MKFLPYTPEQAYLRPRSVREVLGENPICFFVHQAVERLEHRIRRRSEIIPQVLDELEFPRRTQIKDRW